MVPYIYEDYVTIETAAEGLYNLFKKTSDEKNDLRKKVRDYALSEFSYQKTVDDWHQTMKDTIENWRSTYKRWETKEI